MDCVNIAPPCSIPQLCPPVAGKAYLGGGAVRTTQGQDRCWLSHTGPAGEATADCLHIDTLNAILHWSSLTGHGPDERQQSCSLVGVSELSWSWVDACSAVLAMCK